MLHSLICVHMKGICTQIKECNKGHCCILIKGSLECSSVWKMHFIHALFLNMPDPQPRTTPDPQASPATPRETPPKQKPVPNPPKGRRRKRRYPPYTNQPCTVLAAILTQEVGPVCTTFCSNPALTLHRPDPWEHGGLELRQPTATNHAIPASLTLNPRGNSPKQNLGPDNTATPKFPFQTATPGFPFGKELVGVRYRDRNNQCHLGEAGGGG